MGLRRDDRLQTEAFLDKLRALQYFLASADSGSLAGAARQFEVTVPAVQKLINSLEKSVGVQLFERSARGLTLTANGETYREACKPLIEELAAIDESIGRSTRRHGGKLVVAMHSQIAHHLILPRMAEFHQRYPDIHIELRCIHRLSDADAHVAEVFLLHGWPEASDLVHRQLGLARSVVCAAPAYWARHGTPNRPADLAEHNCLVLRNPAGIAIDLWEWVRGAERVSVKVSGWLISNDREVILDSVLAGEGVGRFNVLTTRRQIDAGRLVPVLPDWEVEGGAPMNLLYRSSHRRNPRVRLFIGFIQSILRESEIEGLYGRNEIKARPQWHRVSYGRASAYLRWQR